MTDGSTRNDMLGEPTRGGGYPYGAHPPGVDRPSADPYAWRDGAGDGASGQTHPIPLAEPPRDAEDGRPPVGFRNAAKRRMVIGGVAAAAVVALLVVVLSSGGGGGDNKTDPTLAPASTVDAAASASAGVAAHGPWTLLVNGKPIDGRSLSGDVAVTLGPGTETLTGIKRVKFSLDGASVGDVKKAPFTAVLHGLTPGKHKLSARIRLTSGTKKVEAEFTGAGNSAGAAASPNAAPLPAAAPVRLPAAPPPLRTVHVSSADQLRSALAGARPGDLIVLADGTYSGKFVGRTPATSGAPITVRGSRNAVLDGGSVGSGYVFHLDNGDHWRLEGFTVQDGQKGVMLDRTTGAVIANLMVRDIGQEGIHLRNFSTDNFVAGNTVSGTGRKSAGFGEGIYIGTAKSNWSRFSGGQPDRSDRNQIIGNTVAGTTAENIDIKEATTGGVVRGNHFDGGSISGANSADSWVDVKGNGWLIQGNTGVNSPKDGIQTHVLLDGWGTGNTITGNTLDVRGPGYGVAIDKANATNNVVSCNNVVTDAASGKFNVACR